MKNTILTYLFLSITFSITSQELDINYYIPSNQNYNDKIPTPKGIIGHQEEDQGMNIFQKMEITIMLLLSFTQDCVFMIMLKDGKMINSGVEVNLL